MSEDTTSKRFKANSVSFSLSDVDFAVVQHKGNYFEVVCRLDPVFRHLVDETPKEHLDATVSYEIPVSFVHDESYDSVIVPRVVCTESGLRVHSAVLLVLQDVNFKVTSDIKGFMDAYPFACCAI